MSGVARADDVVVPLQPEQQVEPQAVGLVVVADDLLDRGIAGRQGLGVAILDGQQPAAIGVVTRQHAVVRLLEPDRLLQVAERLRPLGRGRGLARGPRRLDRGTGAPSPAGASIARLNCSTASSGRPCFRKTSARAADASDWRSSSRIAACRSAAAWLEIAALEARAARG